MIEQWQLKQRQGLSLKLKIALSQRRIRTFYDYFDGNVYISFSGGKDSTVLLHLVRELYPNVPAVFVDTGLEHPEIKEFVRTVKNVKWVRPKMSFNKVLEKYGYPIISKEVSQKIRQYRTAKSEKTKHTRWYGANNKYKSGKIPEKWKFLVKAPFKISEKCCNVMKKNPLKEYKCFIGTMAQESHLRKQQYLRTGCNSFNNKIRSMPLSFWLKEDIWNYIHSKNLPYCEIYDKGIERTGCMFCMFGVHLEKKPNRFQRMFYLHQKLWKYCIKDLGCGKVMDYAGIKYKPDQKTGTKINKGRPYDCKFNKNLSCMSEQRSYEDKIC